MSGIEVAGLILGAIPIVVEAFEQYQKVRKICDNSRKKTRAQHLRFLAATLNDNHVLIRVYINRVLEDAGVIEGPIEHLSPDEVLDLLDTGKAQKLVKRHLGPVYYRSYIGVLEKCQEVILDIAGSFEGLLPNSRNIKPLPSAFLRELLTANTSSKGPPIWSFRGKKLRFLMEKEAIAEKMNFLEKQTDMLGKLCTSISTSDVHIDSRPSPKTVQKLTKFLSTVQAHACDLYSAIIERIPPSAACHDQHSVRLFLDPRVEFLLKPRLPKCAVSFDIELAGFKPIGITHTWHRGFVALLEEDNLPEESPQTNPASKSKVRFSVSIPCSPTSPLACMQVSSVLSSRSQLKPLDRLCHVIREAQSCGQIVRLHLSKNGKLSYTRKQADDQSELKPAERPHIQLREVLERVHNKGPEKLWSLTQRMHLAFKIASSVLQLNRTPWLSDSCTADSIYFLQTQMDALALAPRSRPVLPFDANRPFLTRVGAPGFNCSECRDPTAQTWMLDFAILLLEIWERKTFRQWAEEEGKQTKGPHLHRLELAQSWWADIHQDISEYYKCALSRCLEGASLNTHSWEDGTFQQRFCSDVVIPLWENCKDMQP